MRTTIGILLATASLGAFTGAASAADIMPEAPTAWDGFYIGVHGGYGTGEFTNLDKNATDCWYCTSNYGSDVDGFIGGGTVGYNFTAQDFLFGIEGELGLSNISGSATQTEFDYPYQPQTEIDTNYYGTIAGRLGYIVGDVMLYGKAGWGFMNAAVDWKDLGYEAQTSWDELLSTWVWGVGVEYAFSPAVSVKLEYLRFQYGDTETFDIKDDVFPGFKQDIEIDGINTFKVGLNYHF